MSRSLGAAAIVVSAVLLAGCDGPFMAGASPTPEPTAGAIEGEDASKLPPFPSPGASPTPITPSPATPQNVTATFDDIQAKWQAAFTASGLQYPPATLRLFTSSVDTACGAQTSEVGPFYCPGDKTVNLDLTFFVAIERLFGVRGFAVSYVIAHEVGHHVQLVLGVMHRVAQMNQQNPAGANALSIRVELQADCFGGVWAHTAYARDIANSSDIEDALKAAAVVGDDFQSSLSPGQSQPENWTHGTSAQRQRWFTVGFDSGSAASCDTFSVPV